MICCIDRIRAQCCAIGLHSDCSASELGVPWTQITMCAGESERVRGLRNAGMCLRPIELATLRISAIEYPRKYLRRAPQGRVAKR